MPPAEQVYAENLALRAENATLRAQIDWLKREVFGPGKSEKLDRLQTALALNEVAQAAPSGPSQKISYERSAAPREKPAPPAEAFRSLPVVETVELVPEEVKAAPDQYERIGEERTFEVDIIEPKLVKREIVRVKFRHRLDRAKPPVVAPAPVRIGGFASAGLLAWIAVSKYVNHLPLFRLEKMSARWGTTLPRQTVADWVERTAFWLEPIYKRMHQRLLCGDYLQADETPIRCNDPDEKHGGTTEGRLWVITRPEEDVIFDWRLSRRHEELTTLLGNFAGILQSDGYAGYAAHARARGLPWVACWAHTRRKFFDAQAERPKAAALVLKLIGRLYQGERRADELGLSGAARAEYRQTHYTRPLHWLRKVVLGLRERVLPKSGLGKACDYLLSHWEPLTAHLRLGQTRLDTNLVENAIRPSAIGKKNWLFIGHPQAGQRSAIIYSLVVSCQRHGKDPMAYLRDVLSRLPHLTNQDNLDPLTPRFWEPRLS